MIGQISNVVLRISSYCHTTASTTTTASTAAAAAAQHISCLCPDKVKQVLTGK